MPWMSLPWADEHMNKLRAKFNIMGVPALVILDAQTGLTVTATARKDLKKDVTEVYAAWAELLDLKRVQAVERAELDAEAQTQLNERARAAALKKAQEKANQELQVEVV